MAPDFVYMALECRWVHPETGVVIDDEYMPAELVPEPAEPPLTWAAARAANLAAREARERAVADGLDPSPRVAFHA